LDTIKAIGLAFQGTLNTLRQLADELQTDLRAACEELGSKGKPIPED